MREPHAVHARLAGHHLELRAPTPGIQQSIRQLLRHHVAPPAVAGSRCLRLRLAFSDECPPKTALCRSTGQVGGEPWCWELSREMEGCLAERFYYWALLPLLVDTLAGAGVARFHGALLSDERTGPVVLLGGSGTGKTTAAAAWVEHGGALVTDDTILIQCAGDALRCHGLHRPLHVDPQVVPRLAGLSGLASCSEYLPGRRKLDYDCFERLPGCRGEEMGSPAQVLVSRVDPGGRTRLEPLDPGELADAIEEAMHPPDHPRAEAPADAGRTRDRLLACPALRVVWGDDVWRRPLAHLGFLREHLPEGRSRCARGGA